MKLFTMSKSLNFFSTELDLKSLLVDFEQSFNVKYVRAGLFDDSNTSIYHSVNEIAELGTTSSPDQNQSPCYLILSAEEEIQVNPIEQRRGGTKYAVNQSNNPESVIVRTGGLYGGSCIISGQIGTCTTHLKSLDMMNELTRIMTKNFTQIKSYLVGKEARRFMTKGYRLTSDARMSDDYDLVE